MIIINIEFQFFSWFSVAVIFVICGTVSYILLEKNIARKKKKTED